MKNLFKAGNTASVGKGRPRGSINKKSTLQNLMFDDLKDKLPDLSKEYWDMSPGQKLRFFEVILPFSTPRLAATTVDQWSNRTKDEVEEAASKLVDKLLKSRDTIKLKANGKIEEAITD